VLDVYQEKGCQANETARVRILEPVRPPHVITLHCTTSLDFFQYLVSVVALFQGRVIDQPEEVMVPTEYSTGGEVEHKVAFRLLSVYSPY
jgi:hypothetical protein